MKTYLGISKREMRRYEKCRQSGFTNMVDIQQVKFLTGLSRDKILLVMKNYSILKEKLLNGITKLPNNKN